MGMVAAYRCSRTGLYYPGDYMAEWGRKYGKGLGPVPVSEALVNVYESPIPLNVKRPEQTMHPVANCCAQVDLVQIDEEEYKANRAVLQSDDPDCEKRYEIMRSRQLINSTELSRLFPEESKIAREADVVFPRKMELAK